MADATFDQLKAAVIEDEEYASGHRYGEAQCFSCAFFHELDGEAGEIGVFASTLVRPERGS
jgi:hypothetical protein